MKEIKYLGVIINDDINDNDDMVRHKKYIYGKGNLLIQKCKACSDGIKLRLFRTFCYNAYGGHLWTVYKTHAIYGQIINSF